MAKCNQLTSLPFKGLSIKHCSITSRCVLRQCHHHNSTPWFSCAFPCRWHTTLFPWQSWMTPNTFECDFLTALHFKGLNRIFAPFEWLARKIIPEMTDNVSSGMLNPAVPCHSDDDCCGELVIQSWAEGGVWPLHRTEDLVCDTVQLSSSTLWDCDNFAVDWWSRWTRCTADIRQSRYLTCSPRVLLEHC